MTTGESPGDDPFDAFMGRVRLSASTRSADIAAVRGRIGSLDGVDERLDDQLEDLRSDLAARCANCVPDHEGEAAIEQADHRFSNEVANAAIETRIAALLTVMTADEIAA